MDANILNALIITGVVGSPIWIYLIVNTIALAFDHWPLKD